MEKDIKACIFDLFFTLIIPAYTGEKTEYGILGITKEEWEHYAEDQELYMERASGKVKVAEEIIENILDKMGRTVSASDKAEILKIRVQRMKQALFHIDPLILSTLRVLKEKQIKLCLISNADVIDTMYWSESPLALLFDEVIFSHKVSFLKPHPKIYQIALDKMKIRSEQCFYVGDGGSEELKGAREVGMKTVLSGYLIKNEGQNEILQWADYYISDFNEIISVLNE